MFIQWMDKQEEGGQPHALIPEPLGRGTEAPPAFSSAWPAPRDCLFIHLPICLFILNL